jgi:hypothetical protein
MEMGKIKGMDVFRIKAAFYGVSEEKGEKERCIIVQPNFEIIAFPETPDDVLYMLNIFSVMKSADKVHIFAITKKSVLNALDTGMDVGTIVEVLQTNAKSESEVPQNVLYTIKEWSGLYGKVALKRGFFLEADAGLMKLIKERIGGEIIREISDSVVIIKEEKTIRDLIKTGDEVFLEIEDEIIAAEVEKAIRKYVIKKVSKGILVIDGEDREKCVNALKRKGIFPQDLIEIKRESEEGEEVAVYDQRKRELIERAIEEGQMIKIVYLGKGGVESERIIEPYDMDAIEVDAYCYSSDDMKSFRLDRIKTVELMGKSYEHEDEMFEVGQESELDFVDFMRMFSKSFNGPGSRYR